MIYDLFQCTFSCFYLSDVEHNMADINLTDTLNGPKPCIYVLNRPNKPVPSCGPKTICCSLTYFHF